MTKPEIGQQVSIKKLFYFNSANQIILDVFKNFGGCYYKQFFAKKVVYLLKTKFVVFELRFLVTSFYKKNVY